MAVFPVFPVFPFGAVRARRACGPKSATICLCLWTTVDEWSWESHLKKRRRLAFIIPWLVLLCLVLTAGHGYWVIDRGLSAPIHNDVRGWCTVGPAVRGVCT